MAPHRKKPWSTCNQKDKPYGDCTNNRARGCPPYAATQQPEHPWTLKQQQKRHHETQPVIRRRTFRYSLHRPRSGMPGDGPIRQYDRAISTGSATSDASWIL